MFDIARRTLALLALSASAWGQAYPERPLRLVVGFAPGGSGDFLARIVRVMAIRRTIKRSSERGHNRVDAGIAATSG